MLRGRQVGCNLPVSEAKALDAYARDLELSRPRLGALLVLREVSARRLPGLLKRYAGSTSRIGAVRVTVRLSAARKDALEEWIAHLDAGSDDAVAVILRAELDERWLERSVLRGRGDLVDADWNRI